MPLRKVLTVHPAEQSDTGCEGLTPRGPQYKLDGAQAPLCPQSCSNRDQQDSSAMLHRYVTEMIGEAR